MSRVLRILATQNMGKSLYDELFNMDYLRHIETNVLTTYGNKFDIERR